MLVLERYAKAGGFTHMFKRKDYDWDVGLHYVGEVHNPDSTIRRLFDEITGDRLEWQAMGDVYDTVVVGDERFEYVAGRTAWRDRMVESFPDEEAAIDRYLELVKETTRGARGFFGAKALPGPLSAIAGPWMRRGFLRHASRTVAEVLDELTDDELLKTVLTAQYGDYGLTPKNASFGIHAMVFNHYLRGAGYPVGGSGRIAAEIIPEIEAAGGAVVVGAEVARILMERGRAVGVTMADDREFRAPFIISDAGVPNTVRQLLPADAPGRRALASVLKRVTPSTSHICLYVGLDASDEELGLGTSNLWVFPGPDHDATVERYLADPSAPIPLTYISFPSAKDPDFQNRHPGKATVEVVSIAPYEWFARLGGQALAETRRRLRGVQAATHRAPARGSRPRGAAARWPHRLPRALDPALDPPLRRLPRAARSTASSTRRSGSRPQGFDPRPPSPVSGSPARMSAPQALRARSSAECCARRRFWGRICCGEHLHRAPPGPAPPDRAALAATDVRCTSDVFLILGHAPGWVDSCK